MIIVADWIELLDSQDCARTAFPLYRDQEFHEGQGNKPLTQECVISILLSVTVKGDLFLVNILL
jgi:hypothetical protein